MRGVEKSGVVLIAILILMANSGIGAAAELFVYEGGSIQDAVNNATSNDTIIVYPGTYNEGIDINVPNIEIISLSGNLEDTIIQGSGILIEASDITINGFTLNGPGDNSNGISFVSPATDCIIENNKILNYQAGISLINAYSTSIENNMITENNVGIYVDGNYSNNTLADNNISFNKDCGYKKLSTGNNLIYNNYFNNTENAFLMEDLESSDTWTFNKTESPNIIGGPYIGGNYWATPDGDGFSQIYSDTNGDGIAEEPYYLNEVNIDYLPLVPAGEAPVLPVAKFKSNVTEGYAPFSVQFKDQSENATEIYWDFGDGATSNQQNPTHTYSTAGNYTVTLTATNADGQSANTSEIKVKLLQKPIAAFSASVTSGTAPLKILFTDSSIGEATSFIWNFGDGTNSRHAMNETHTFTKPGIYTVTLTVTNAAGSNTVKKSNYIVVEALKVPKAAFTANGISGSTPLAVLFTDSSTGSPTSWVWSFGDGITSTTQNPTHTYTKPGKYTVTLTVKNTVRSNKVTKPNYINVVAPLKPPVATFSASPTSGKAQMKVMFTDKSTGGAGTSWLWDFGDGTTSTTHNPTHTYTKAGKYTVTFTTTNSAGSNTKTMSGYITVRSK